MRLPALLVFSALILILPGCNKRYWYRNKIRVYNSAHTTLTVKVSFENLSPLYLQSSFCDDLSAFAVERLKKKGFTEVDADTADYQLEIELEVDSFTAKFSHPLGADPESYSKLLRQLTISYDMTYGASKHPFWHYTNEFYFFMDESDLRRSRSMMRYSLNRLPETREKTKTIRF